MSLPPELLSWADFLAKIGQFLFGLCSLLLALWAAIYKSKDFFRSELSKRQLEELGSIRSSLQSVFFDFYYMPSIKHTMVSMGWSFEDLKKHDLKLWEQIERYNKTSTDLFYKFIDSNYYLFPDWLEKERLERFGKSMRTFVPFTLSSAVDKSDEVRGSYFNEILNMKEYLDVSLKKRG
ncbi:hypothetical protein [Pseudomonas putida]|uniref:hypothetical protein n=1 Tax=Pseudomonas putida TaxID=303 RepID=UPI0009A1E2A8|nr:hypothetical protein [Pseudomonas putida]